MSAVHDHQPEGEDRRGADHAQGENGTPGAAATEQPSGHEARHGTDRDPDQQIARPEAPP